jgi:hypothetical protein
MIAMLPRRERAPDADTEEAQCLSAQRGERLERKKDWLSKALILLRKSSDLSNLSDLSGWSVKPTLEYERTRSRRPGRARPHIVGNGRRGRAQSESGALPAFDRAALFGTGDAGGDRCEQDTGSSASRDLAEQIWKSIVRNLREGRAEP